MVICVSKSIVAEWEAERSAKGMMEGGAASPLRENLNIG